MLRLYGFIVSNLFLFSSKNWQNDETFFVFLGFKSTFQSENVAKANATCDTEQSIFYSILLCVAFIWFHKHQMINSHYLRENIARHLPHVNILA